MEIQIRDKGEIAADWKKIMGEGRQGSIFRLPVGRELFPAMSPPQLELILLDPADGLYAVRRISNPIRGRRKKGDWQLTGIDGAVEEAVRWGKEMLTAIDHKAGRS